MMRIWDWILVAVESNMALIAGFVDIAYYDG